jgi:translation initiation factor 1
MDPNRRLVYSTDPAENQRCPACKELLAACTCTAPEAVPASVTVKLRLEKAGRGGKAVTVLYDLPQNPAFLKELVTKLKKACGTGGTAKASSVELQGDWLAKCRELLPKWGYKVKG